MEKRKLMGKKNRGLMKEDVADEERAVSDERENKEKIAKTQRKREGKAVASHEPPPY